MTIDKPPLTLAALCARFEDNGPGREGIVPFEGRGVFHELAECLAAIMADFPPHEITAVAAGAAVESADAVDRLRALADEMVVLGAGPEEWDGATNIARVPWSEAGLADETGSLLAVLTEECGCLIALAREDTSGTESVERGFWTCVPEVIHEFLGNLGGCGLGAAASRPACGVNGPAGAGLRLGAKLMARQAAELSRQQRDARVDKDDLFSVLEILKAISAKRRSHDILYVFVEKIAEIIGIDRCSVVRMWTGSTLGHVLASHEDAKVHNLTIDLPKYPELLHTLCTGQKTVINDVATNPHTQEYAGELARAGLQSILVVPIVLHDENVGSLFLRAARRDTPFSTREVNFCEIVAEAAANALERAHLFESIQRANQRLEHLAITDGLTGLNNHRYFRERLDEEFGRSQRYRLPLSLLMLDIDNFKAINDTFGHLHGDSILRELAKRIRRTVRKSDIVARYGGEEFAVLLPQTGLDGARVEADRILRVVRNRPFAGLPHRKALTVSAGLAVLGHNKMKDAEALIRVADDALYRAKWAGKDKVVIGSLEGDA